MTPPVTAAARMRPASYAAQRPSHVAPLAAAPASVAPVSISPERIRRGRPSIDRGLVRPAVRRYSGEIQINQSIGASTLAGAAMDFKRDLSAVEIPSFSLPRINWRALKGRKLSLSVPRPGQVAGAVRSAPDHPLTRYLASTRVWVGVLAALTGGLIFLQVQILHVNAGIGENVQKIASLQRQNAELRTAVSGLGSDQRIVAEAQRMGFVEPPVGSSHFTAAREGDAGRALALLTPSTAAAGMVAADEGTTQPVSSDSNQTSGSSGSDTNGADNGQSAGYADSTTPSGDSVGGTSGASNSGAGSPTTTTAAAPDGGSSPLSG